MQHQSLKAGEVEFGLTNRKEIMQNEPRESNENNFMALLNFIVDPAVIVDEKGHILLVNVALENLTGLSKKELIGKSFFELSNLTAESKAGLLENLMKRMQGLSVAPYEINFTDKTGENRYAEVKAKKIDYAGQPADLVIFRDITRRKKNAKRLKEYAEKMEALVNDKVKEVKESAQKLRESEEKYRKQFEEALDAIVLADAETGIIIDCNRATSELVGREKSELVGEHQRILHPLEEREGEFSRTFKQHLKEKEGLVLETQVITKRGEIRDVAIKANIFELGDKKVIQGIFRDITEQKKAEETLRMSEEKYRELINGINDTIWVIDFDGKFIDVNDTAVKVLGYSREKLLSMGPPDIDTSLTVEQIRDLIKQMPTDQIQIFETTHTTKDGKTIPVEISSSLVIYQGKQAILSIARDITERRKMEAEIRQERDTLEAVTENVGAGLAIISKDYRILWANKLLKQIGDIENKLCYSTFNTIDTICPDCGVKKVFENGVSFDRHEYSCPPHKDKTRWVELIVTPIKDKDGTVIAALELSIDTTERKLMQNKLEEYSQKLEKLVEQRTEELEQTHAKLAKSERLATIGELAGMVGHDLRNPLTGIKGAVYYLKAKCGAETDVKGKEMFEVIEKDINYSNKIINDLLDYSRDLTLELANTTPKLLLKNALSLIEVPERIKIIDATEDKPEIKVDREKMNRAFVNIITNAIDAMPEGGALTVTSKAVKGNVKIAFKDTGTGMSEETLSKLKLWSPLFTTKAKGMGFGLPVCKRIVEAHGGKISVESTLGKGTTVTITIPVNPQPVNEGEEKWIFNESWLSATPTAEGAP